MAKRRIIKLFVVFGALIFIFSFSGCLDDIHIHKYQLIVNSTEHYYVCECGKEKNKGLHEFIWIVDKEATKDECGYEHEECTICGYKQNESLIEIGIPPITSETIHFTNGNDLEQYVLNNEIKCLYINKIKKQNEEIECCDDFFNEYKITFDKENEEYINPCVQIYISLYSNYLGCIQSSDDTGLPRRSISFSFKLWEYDDVNELEYEFYEYNDDKTIFNNLINIYSGNIKVGEVLYYESVGVPREWIIEFLNENLIY